MYLSQTNIKELRHKIEKEEGFQIVLVPMQTATFLNVKIATDALYKALINAGISVLVDDRDEKPQNKFEVVQFLKIRHRLVISSRSISAGVYEYLDRQTDCFEKVPEEMALEFLKRCVSSV